MHREDDQPLWDLMGSVPAPAVSPFFARNIVRLVRLETNRRERLHRWLSWRRLLPLSVLGAAAAALLVTSSFSFRPAPAAGDDLLARIDARDYEVVADLDNLLASDESNLWDDTSSL